MTPKDDNQMNIDENENDSSEEKSCEIINETNESIISSSNKSHSFGFSNSSQS